MLKNAFITISFLLTVVGCAHKTPITLEQLDESLAANKAASTRSYQGVKIKQVREASQKVLYLLDPKDIKFDVRESELLGTRFSTYYAVFSFGFGRDWYSITMKETNEGVESTFGLEGVMLSGLPSPIPESSKSHIPVSAHSNPADYKLFHDRVEYFLGLKPEWTTCDHAKRAQADPMKEMLLCDLIGLENLSPNQALKN